MTLLSKLDWLGHAFLFHPAIVLLLYLLHHILTFFISPEVLLSGSGGAGDVDLWSVSHHFFTLNKYRLFIYHVLSRVVYICVCVYSFSLAPLWVPSLHKVICYYLSNPGVPWWMSVCELFLTELNLYSVLCSDRSEQGLTSDSYLLSLGI